MRQKVHVIVNSHDSKMRVLRKITLVNHLMVDILEEVIFFLFLSLFEIHFFLILSSSFKFVVFVSTSSIRSSFSSSRSQTTSSNVALTSLTASLTLLSLVNSSPLLNLSNLASLAFSSSAQFCREASEHVGFRRSLAKLANQSCFIPPLKSSKLFRYPNLMIRHPCALSQIGQFTLTVQYTSATMPSHLSESFSQSADMSFQL